MPQVIRCGNCKTAMQVGDDAAGKQFRCPSCKTVFTVPAPSPAVVAAAKVPVGAGAAVAGAPAIGPAPPPSAAASSPPRKPAPAPAKAAPPPAAAARPPAARPAAPVSSTPAPAATAAPTECPACRARWNPGAIACMDCGYLIQSEPTVSELEGAPTICPNPACGVANPPSERYCQRCSSPLPTAPGTILHGRYRVERLLAMGGFGAVYLATDLKANNRQVAIKDMICQDSQEFAIRLNFFRREAEILKLLDAVPIVPRVHDLVEQGQTAHLVLEFIRGKDLLKILEANGNQPFAIERIIEWSCGVCDVLQHMHSQSPPLVHRDLKPENIMLLEDGKSIKMIDFGTARDLGRTQKEKMAAKTRVYTEGYAPPEQIVGKPEPRSDLFALAGTMYHLATGKSPEGHYTADELKARLAEPQGCAPDERWFWELVCINLSEDVNERYFSAREIKADLEKRQVTREAVCPKCQTANKVREYPYCQKCGEALTDPTPPCHHCGKSNRMGSRCCIHCGNRLR